MFVPIMDVNPGDVIIYEHDNQWSYHNVTAHRREEMAGIRNPGFSDGGLPIVSGVLATTSVTTYRGVFSFSSFLSLSLSALCSALCSLSFHHDLASLSVVFIVFCCTLSSPL